MAHVSLHAAIGMAAGLAIGLPGLASDWKSGLRVARPLARWCLLGAACAAWAVVPSLLRRAGFPETVCAGPIMNIFFLHPLAAHLRHLTGFLGPMLLAGLLVAQYAVILAALRRAESTRSRSRIAGDEGRERF